MAPAGRLHGELRHRRQGVPHGSLQNALGALEALRHMANRGDTADGDARQHDPGGKRIREREIPETQQPRQALPMFPEEKRIELPERLGRTNVTCRPAREILTRASGFVKTYDFTLNPYSGCSFGCSCAPRHAA